MTSFKDIDTGSSNGNFFKIVEGENKFRIVSEAVPVWTSFDQAEGTAKKYITAEGSTKDKEAKKRFALWVIDRTDNAIKLAEFPSTVMVGIKDLANSSETGFDGLPPYDMIINRAGTGMATRYTVMASRKNTELTDAEKAEVAKLEPVLMVLRKDAVDGSEIAPF